MRKRLLNYLICPDCKASLELMTFHADLEEIESGVVHCANAHFFPIVTGIPRMLPGSFKEYWSTLRSAAPDPLPEPLAAYLGRIGSLASTSYDIRTKANFSNEWDNHDIGGKTWTMELNDRVRWFFLEPIRISKDDLENKLMLDAGCGNGSQSVGYTEFGLEVVALDLSTGLEKGHAFRKVYSKCRPERIHFVQADLQNPPLRPDLFDIIHSAGVLHHTPDTERTFRVLAPLLKKGGTFYVWLYKYEKVVTPLVNSIRSVTTRIPATIFARIANVTAIPFIGFCWTVNKLGIRPYQTPDKREAALAVHDIFGAPYAHYHDFDEVAGWFRSIGLDDVWPCNDDRRGFGVCGRAEVI